MSDKKEPYPYAFIAAAVRHAEYRGSPRPLTLFLKDVNVLGGVEILDEAKLRDELAVFVPDGTFADDFDFSSLVGSRIVAKCNLGKNKRFPKQIVASDLVCVEWEGTCVEIPASYGSHPPPRPAASGDELTPIGTGKNKLYPALASHIKATFGKTFEAPATVEDQFITAIMLALRVEHDDDGNVTHLVVHRDYIHFAPAGSPPPNFDFDDALNVRMRISSGAIKYYKEQFATITELTQHGPVGLTARVYGQQLSYVHFPTHDFAAFFDTFCKRYENRATEIAEAGAAPDDDDVPVKPLFDIPETPPSDDDAAPPATAIPTRNRRAATGTTRAATGSTRARAAPPRGRAAPAADDESSDDETAEATVLQGLIATAAGQGRATRPAHAPKIKLDVYFHVFVFFYKMRFTALFASDRPIAFVVAQYEAPPAHAVVSAAAAVATIGDGDGKRSKTIKAKSASTTTAAGKKVSKKSKADDDDDDDDDVDTLIPTTVAPKKQGVLTVLNMEPGSQKDVPFGPFSNQDQLIAQLNLTSKPASGKPMYVLLLLERVPNSLSNAYFAGSIPITKHKEVTNRLNSDPDLRGIATLVARGAKDPKKINAPKTTAK
jgi:hypothetical protein